MIAALKAFATERRGTSAIEFAVILPVMLSFMAGMVEFGRAYQTYNDVNRLAARYAMSWADCTSACGTEMAMYTTASAEQNIAPQLTQANITLRMMQFKMGTSCSTNAPDYAYPASTTPNATECAVAQNAIATDQTGVVVTVTYTYSPLFFAALMNPILGTKVFSYTVAQDKS